MLVISPREVVFNAKPWPGVRAVVVDRAATREAIAWSDRGPHVEFADAPEQKVTIRVVRDLVGDEVDDPKPGEQATIRFAVAATAGDGGRVEVAVLAAVVRVTHELKAGGGAVQTVVLVGVASDGGVDPVTVTNHAEAS